MAWSDVEARIKFGRQMIQPQSMAFRCRPTEALRHFRRTPSPPYIAIVVVAALLGVYVWPLLDVHPEQDACSFGPVSNERYRELLAEAKKRQATVWPAVVWDQHKSESVLNERFDDLSRGMTSVYERLAALHAVMRALGGDYRRGGFGVPDPYPKLIQGVGFMPLEYHVDLNRLYFFFPFRRQLVVIGRLVVRDDPVVPDKSRSRKGDIQFTVRFPMLLEDYVLVPRSELGESCPVVPAAGLAERLANLHQDDFRFV